MIRGVYSQSNTFRRLLIFTGLLLSGFGISTVIGLLAARFAFGLDVIDNPVILTDFEAAGVVPALKLLQLLNSAGIFFFPVLMYAFMVAGNTGTYLSLKVRPSALNLTLTALVMVASMPLVNFIVALNLEMDLPDSLRALETWMREKEDSAGNITEIFLEMNSTASFLVNILVIAMVPALGEELLFRSFIQKRIETRTDNPHLGIWVAAFLFSAIHMQFYGFLPRFLLGGMFGYLLAWSGSIWLPFTAHFVNNAGAVCLRYFFGREFTEENIDTVGIGEGEWYYLAGSALAVSFLMMRIRKEERRGKGPAVSR